MRSGAARAGAIVLALCVSIAASREAPADAQATAPRHRAETGVSSFVTPVPAGGQRPVTEASSHAALPTANAILRRYRAAIGGESLIRKYTSRRATGRFELPAQGIGGPVELVAAAPDRMRLRIDLGALGAMQRGYDGKVGWAIDPAVGPRLLSGAELEEVRHSADFYYDLHDPAGFRSITVIRRAPFEGRDCYAVRLVRPSGFELVEYFDVRNGLIDGMRMSSSSPMGTVPDVVTVLDDYRRFGGLLMATVARQKALGIDSTLTLDHVEYDTVPDAAFAMPPEIAALAR
jgi:hypothetical protein